VARQFHVFAYEANPSIDPPDEYVSRERKEYLVASGVCRIIGPRALQRGRTRKFDNRSDATIDHERPVHNAHERGASGWRIVGQTQKPRRGRVPLVPGCPKCSTVR
jgi:hypothetical protein